MTHTLIIGGVVAVGMATTLEAYLQAGGTDGPGDWGYLALTSLDGKVVRGILRYRLDAVQGDVVTPPSPPEVKRAASYSGRSFR